MQLLCESDCAGEKNGATPAMPNRREADLLIANISLLRVLEESQRSELRWRYALEGSNQAVWDHDYKLDIFYYSPTWRSMRGLPAVGDLDLSLAGWLKGVHPDDHEHVLAEIGKQNSGERIFSKFQYRERHANGQWMWIESRGSIVDWLDNGKPGRIVGTDTDITARKNDEATIEEVSRRLRLALDVSGVGVFEANLDTACVSRDERLLQIYGIEDFQAGQAWNILSERLHPDDRSACLDNIERGTRSGQPFSDQFRIITPAGDVKHVRAHSLTFRNADGESTLVGANWDVTRDMTLQENLEQARQRIESLVYLDELTGLANRRGLSEQLKLWQGQTGSYSALIHVDLDRFKDINDTMGHRVGDAVLIQAAAALRAAAGSDDFIARIGGDEFVILCAPRDDDKQIAVLAEEIVTVLRKPVLVEEHLCRFGASVGLAWTYCGHVSQTLVNADIALSRAKSLGRNRVEVFTEALQNEISQRKRLADEVAYAIEIHQFIPYYQPQYDAKSLKLVGVETLARWDHPSRGIIAPDGFLKVAEEMGAIAEIDKQIAEAAIRDFNGWQLQGIAIPRVAINISSRRLQDPGLVEAMSADHIPKTGLSFELLESMFLDDLGEDAHKVVSDLKKLGIDIEIDDFGTGHASIVGLLKLSPKRLKIDRSIIKPIVDSKEQRALVRSIIEIGHSLGIEVVAEGVETKQHIVVLRKLGCDILQGYALGRPMAKDTLERQLAA